MQEEFENLEFVRGVNFDIIDSLKNNGLKYLLVFDDSCEEICNSQAFVDIATARRQRGLSTIYIKHNLFHQSKLGRDVELQNTYIVLFKSPRDVMQVTTLRTQLGFGSEIVDWYWDAKSVPFGHLLIALSPRTEDWLRYCTDIGSILSKFYFSDRLIQLKFLDDEHKKFLYSPSVPIIFPQTQKSFPAVLPKEFIMFFCKCIINLLKGNLQSIKRHHMSKLQSEVRLLSLKRTIGSKEETFWRPKEGYSSLEFLLLPSIAIWLDMEQFVLVPASVYNKGLITETVTKQKLPNFQPSWNPPYQIDSPKQEINKKWFAKADYLSCPRIKLSKSQTLFLNGVETGIFPPDFAQQLRSKNAHLPDVFSTLLDAAGISPTLILNHNAKAKERGSWVPFKIWTSEAAKAVHTGCCCLCLCVQLSES